MLNMTNASCSWNKSRVTETLLRLHLSRTEIYCRAITFHKERRRICGAVWFAPFEAFSGRKFSCWLIQLPRSRIQIPQSSERRARNLLSTLMTHKINLRCFRNVFCFDNRCQVAARKENFNFCFSSATWRWNTFRDFLHDKRSPSM